MVVINGSYRERGKRVEEVFYSKHSIATSCVKGGLQEKKKRKKEVQHAKKTRMPKSSRKVKGLKGKKEKKKKKRNPEVN